MSNQIVISSGAKVRSLEGVLTGTAGIVNALGINVANGIPQLDGSGKILVSQLPNSVMEYKGTWNAATNTPTLANGTGNQGDVYLCNVAGTTDFGAGPITFFVGDQVIYSGTIWQRASGATGTVTSVAVTESGDALTITGSPITTSGTINIGFAGISGQYINGAGGLTTFPTLISSIGLSMPSAFSVANSPLTANGTIAVTGAGVASQYIRGDGTLANFPTSGGGGGSVSYYLNGSVNQGTFVGNTYYEMGKVPVIGAGTDFTINADGYISQFITDAGDPALLEIPAGNWNFEMYFSASSGGGTPSFYVELYKYNGSTFTLISSSSATPEGITGGTAIDLYTTALAVPTTALTLTDRLAVRVYVTHSGRTITLHTEDNHLCQVITTFSTGITALNGLTAQVQFLATGTSGTDFNISSTTATHTFNIPDASATARGLITTGTQTIAGLKTFSSAIKADSGIRLKDGVATGGIGYVGIGSNAGQGLTLGIYNSGTVYYQDLFFPITNGYQYTFPAATGTLALTSDISYPVTSVFGRTGAVVATEGDYSLTQLSDVTITSPTNGQVLKYNGTAWVNDTDANTGTVTSVDMSVPTGLSISGNPITTSGTLAVTFASGYSIPTTIKQSNWDDAYTFVAAFPTQTGNAGKYLTTNGSSLSWADNPLGTVTSVGLSSATSGVTIGSSPITTSGTITLSIATASGSQNGLLSSTDFTTFNNKANALSGTINTIAYWDSATTIASLALATYPSLTELSYVKGVTSAIQTQLNGKQGTLTLTTTGTSGAATLVGDTLNIPQYSGGGGAGMAIGGSITSATAGSVLFVGASGVLAQDNTGLFFDVTNDRLGIGSTTLGSSLQINGNAAIGYSASTAAPTNGLAVSGLFGVGTSSVTLSQTGQGMQIGDNTSNAGIRFNMVATGIGYFEYYVGATAKYLVGYRDSNTSYNIRTGTSFTAGNGITLLSTGQTDIGNSTSFLKVIPAWNAGTGTWLDMSTDGASAIGSGGAGTNPWVAYAASATQWFTASTTGDICYRNTVGKLLFGNSTTFAMAISGGNVGIATTTIGSKLQVNGNAAIGYSASTAAPTNGLAVSGSVGIGTTSISNPISFVRVLNISGGDAALVLSNSNGTAKNWSIGALDTGNLVILDGTNFRVRIDGSGNFGIGVAPTQQLQVGGTGNILVAAGGTFFSLGQLYIRSGASQPLDFGANNNNSLMRLDTSGNLGLGTTTIGSKFQVNGSAAIGYSASTVAPNNGLVVSGIVGIGTTSTKSYSSLTNNGQFVNLSNIIINAGQAYTFNKYYNSGTGTDKAVSTGYAADFYLKNDNGSVIWRSTAGSVSADADVTMINRFEITSSGEWKMTPSANTAMLSTTGAYSLTGANAQSLLDLAGTWNTTGNPTAIKLNITNTASGSSARLIDLQIGGTSQFLVNKLGRVLVGTTTDNGQGVLQANGAITALNVSLTGEAVSATTTFNGTYYKIITAGTSAGQTFTLLSPTSNNYQYVVVNKSSFPQTISAGTGFTIFDMTGANSATITLVANGRCFIIADGSGFYQIF